MTAPQGGVLVIMGSGETAPTMIKPHRRILERAGDAPAVLLDTPYGFQENADDISSRAVGYFANSVGRRIEVVTWRTAPPPGLDRERALANLRDAGWVFAGPGSPTYTLRQWRDTPVPGLLAGVLERGGVVLFASAAALTLGSHTVPVYEIYKAGEAPRWVPGLDLVRAATGLPAVVIPHFDNAEGGHHDTRYCYLGERRLSMMESELPDEAFVLGVDEHTGLLLDLATRTATVLGNGGLTVRRRGRTTRYPSGAELTFDEIAAAAAGTAPASAGAFPGGGSPVGGSPDGAARRDTRDGGTPADADHATSLGAAADVLAARFSAAYGDRDIDGCVSAVLDLEQTILDWSADTLTSSEGDHARALLRDMVVRLGELARDGARDPRERLAPLVDLALQQRAQARAGRDFGTADRIRDRLAAAGVEVRDTRDGVEWDVVDPADPPGQVIR